MLILGGINQGMRLAWFADSGDGAVPVHRRQIDSTGLGARLMERVYFATIDVAVERRDLDDESFPLQIPQDLLERLGCRKFRERGQQPALQEGTVVALNPLYRDQDGNLVAVVTRSASRLRAKLSASA